MPKNLSNFSSSENHFVTNKNEAFILLNVGTINIKIATCCENEGWMMMKKKEKSTMRKGRQKFRSGQYQKLKSTEKCWQFPIAAAANVQAL